MASKAAKFAICVVPANGLRFLPEQMRTKHRSTVEETKPRGFYAWMVAACAAYQTAYLALPSASIEKLKLQGPLDVGSAFDLVVGTSTGGIVACGLAAKRAADANHKGSMSRRGRKSSRFSGFDLYPSSASSFIRHWHHLQEPGAAQDADRHAGQPHHRIDLR